MVYAEAALNTIFLVIGGMCTLSDCKKGIVPNQYLLIGMSIGFAVHLINLIVGGAPYYPVWLINMAVADSFAALMYAEKIWAAGDTKFFMLLYFLTPPQLLDAGTLSYSVIPYIFIFVTALLYIFLDSLLRLIRHEPQKQPAPFSTKGYISGITSIFIETTALYCIFYRLISSFFINNELLFSTIMILYAYFCGTRSVMKKWYVIAPHAIAVLVFLFLGKWAPSIPDWRIYSLMAVIIPLQRFCAMYNYQQIPTTQIKPGMILSAETIFLFSSSRVHHLPHDPSEELTARIDDTEAEAVKRWEGAANGQPNIWIVRKVSFAVMIFIGFILWLIIRVAG